MAKESSFDVVSTVDMQEIDNAYQQAARELTQRYDLKGTGATLELSKKDGAFKIEAPSEFVASQVRDILGSKLVKRGIDLSAIRWADPQAATGMSVRQAGTIVQGIDQDTAMQVVAVGFIISVLQDSTETGLNSSSDVLFTIAACYRADRIRAEQEAAKNNCGNN